MEIGYLLILGFAIYSVCWITNSHLDRIEERLTKRIEQILEGRKNL